MLKVIIPINVSSLESLKSFKNFGSILAQFYDETILSLYETKVYTHIEFDFLVITAVSIASTTFINYYF